MVLRKAAIVYRLNRAKELLFEVSVCKDNGFNATVINRLYYACFHATNALLLTRDITAKTHSGVISMLYEHFVKPGVIEKQKAAFYSSLMQERLDDDYSDFIVVDDETVEEFYQPAVDYVTYLEEIINSVIEND